MELLERGIPMGQTPFWLYALMRKTFAATGGWSNDQLSKVISRRRPRPSFSGAVRGVLGTLGPADVGRIVNGIEERGYCQFDVRVPESVVDRVVNYARTLPCHVRGLEKVGFVHELPGWPRYDFSPGDLVAQRDLAEWVTDDTFREVAAAYLRCDPVCDLIAMWWSLPSDHHRSEAAQLFHFDMDRIKFLKFFVYLTDVTLETGPHCFIEGSHRRLPWRFRRDGRFEDRHLEAYFGSERIRRFVGPRGTILAVDTRGFHKGEPVVSGCRLLFQVEFANSLFGMSYPKIQKTSIHPAARARFDARPWTYMQIFE